MNYLSNVVMKLKYIISDALGCICRFMDVAMSGQFEAFKLRIHQNLSLLKMSITMDRVCDVMRFTNLSVDSNE